MLFSSIYTHTLEKAMATHSGTLAWKIPCTEKHGRLQYIFIFIFYNCFLKELRFNLHTHAVYEHRHTKLVNKVHIFLTSGYY